MNAECCSAWNDLADTFLSCRPETMGAVCAIVYLLAIIVFIPFPFYKDLVAATSGGGSKDVLLEVTDVNVGRHLHRFPHNKVRLLNAWTEDYTTDCLS